MSENWFNARKAAQVSAFFANKQGKRIDILKLIKLVYLADRRNMQDFGHPILNDRFVSMPHGPVNSITLNYVNGAVEDHRDWDEFVGRRYGYSVGATRRFSHEELDELSEADCETLERVWVEFGHMDKWELRDWTHRNCPEWEDPDGSANPIPYARVFKFLGSDDPEELAESVYDDRRIDELFAQLKD